MSKDGALAASVAVLGGVYKASSLSKFGRLGYSVELMEVILTPPRNSSAVTGASAYRLYVADFVSLTKFQSNCIRNLENTG